MESYAMSSCQEICEGMQKKLPRELRDKIYECIIGTDITQQVRARSPPSLQGARDSHACDVKYTGSTFKTELVETWYRLVCFQVHSRDDIERFIRRDMWGLGLHPRQHIQKVTFILSGLGVVRTKNDLGLLYNLPKLVEFKLMSPFGCLDNYYVAHLVEHMVYCFSYFEHMLTSGTSVYLVALGNEVRLKKEDLTESRCTEIWKSMGSVSKMKFIA
jgi:hypothetical protein